MALIGSTGRQGEERLLVFDQEEQVIEIGAVPGPQPPALSILRRFSAPVTLQMEMTLEETLQLLAADDDPFSRWEAGQRLFRQVLLARAAAEPDATVESALIHALRQSLVDMDVQQGSELAVLLSLPGMAELEACQEPVDPLALFDAMQNWRSVLGCELKSELHDLLEQCRSQWSQPWPKGQGARSLTGVAWSWLLAAGDAQAPAEALNAVSGPSMTLARAALRALQRHAGPEREEALRVFYDRWKDKPVISTPGLVLRHPPEKWAQGSKTYWSIRGSITGTNGASCARRFHGQRAVVPCHRWQWLPIHRRADC